jgi:carbohydrate-selective porin OprB
MKIQDNKGQFKLTIPRDLVKIKGWKQGTEVIIVMNETGDLIIKEIGGKKRK